MFKLDTNFNSVNDLIFRFYGLVRQNDTYRNTIEDFKVQQCACSCRDNGSVETKELFGEQIAATQRTGWNRKSLNRNRSKRDSRTAYKHESRAARSIVFSFVFCSAIFCAAKTCRRGRSENRNRRRDNRLFWEDVPEPTQEWQFYTLY